MQVDLNEFRAAYLAEIDEHLGAINERMLEVEANRRAGHPQGKALRDLMRLLHTIKGLSSMVGVDPIVDIAHEMESVVRAADQSTVTMADETVEALIAALRAIEARVSALAKNESVPLPPAHLMATLASIVAPIASQPPAALDGDPETIGRLSPSERAQLAAAGRIGRRAIRIDFAPSPRKADAGITITSVRERLGRLGDVVKVMPLARQTSEHAPGGLVFALFLTTDASDETLAQTIGGALTDITGLGGSTAPKTEAPPAVEDDPELRRSGFLRVAVARVDDTIEKLSALIVIRNRLVRGVARLKETGADTRELDTIVVDVTRQLRDLRSALLGVRMVPVGAILDRLPLVVRGLGRTSGKKVRLVVETGNAELDKTVAERIFPALVHLARNAVDHGIERPEERVRAGKPEEGTIRVSAVALGNRFVEIRLEDDGGGIDPVVVARSAKIDDVPRTNVQLLDLLCRAGFSTRAVADRTSGRGVGMDVVKRTIEGLGGALSLETSIGRGTTFSLRVPLTIAVVDAFTLTCSGRRFVVPVPAVAEIVEIDPATVTSAPRGRYFARRGETMALVDLATVLGMEATANAHTAFVVRRSAEEAVAFAVDKVLGQQETVVRPLLDPLVNVVGVAGATDLGDGQPTLVLDLAALSTATRDLPLLPGATPA